MSECFPQEMHPGQFPTCTESDSHLNQIESKPARFLKLDIAKAFDSVGFKAQFGFGQKWRDLIAVSLASASFCVLNGVPGILFLH